MSLSTTRKRSSWFHSKNDYDSPNSVGVVTEEMEINNDEKSSRKRCKFSNYSSMTTTVETISRTSDNMQIRDGVPTLLDLSAKVTSQNICFQNVEERYSLIPEPVQRRLLFWAFPTDENRIRLYSCRSPSSSFSSSSSSQFIFTTNFHYVQTSSSSSSSSDFVDVSNSSSVKQSDSTNDYSAFAEGVRHLENDCVQDALQIGFHLSGTVHSMCIVNGERYAYHVSMAFDRGKITLVKCSCDHRDIHWCHHVVALALYRIRRPERVKFRLTISDSLLQMNRDQLQKLVQYLIAEHYTDVLPTAQRLVDELLLPQSSINAIAGAPDPTAGCSTDSDHRWFLDEAQTRNRVRSYLTHSPCVDELQLLFSKVREMLYQRDDNGPRLLRYMTEEFLFIGSSRSTSTFQPNVLSEKFQQLWDQLGALWVCVALNPYASAQCKSEYVDLLKTWILLPSCPSESAFCLPTNAFCDMHGYQTFGSRQKTVLHRALDACHVKWTDALLLKIMGMELDLTKIDELPLWIEPVPTACARVECLKSHGYNKEALLLAICFVKNVKLRRNFYNSVVQDGWIGHPLDPINTLFDCIHEASKSAPNGYSDLLLSLAIETALIGLAQKRKIPQCRYIKDKSAKQEEKLLDKLKKLNVENNDFLIGTVKRLSYDLLSDNNKSDVKHFETEKPMPLHGLASYLFQVFLSRDPDLAYKIGLQALQLPLSEDQNEDGSFFDQSLTWPIPFASIETRRSNLASNLLISAKDDVIRLRYVLNAIQTNAKSSNMVYRLAHDIYNEALSHPDGSTSRINLLNIAFELGLQVLKIVSSNPNWCRPNVVRWVVNCATSLNFEAVLAVVQNWAQFFTPLEAVSVVARLIWSDTISVQLNLDCRQRTILSHAVYQLAVDCTSKSPSECAVHALSLCKSDAKYFETCYQLVVDAGEKRLLSSEDIFNLAQHMERLGLLPKAYQLSLLALSNVRIGYADEGSPLVSNIYWACSLVESLGSFELPRVVSIIVKNIRCAVVLADVLKLCTFPNRTPMHRVTLLDKQCNLAGAKLLIHTQPHLRTLLDAAIVCFVETVHSKLNLISPRHYCEFIEFLIKARETFVLTDDGDAQFGHLLEHLKILYKGKKKLMALITQRFG